MIETALTWYLDAAVDKPAGSPRQGELIGAEDPQLEHALDIESVWKHCAELPPREQRRAC